LVDGGSCQGEIDTIGHIHYFPFDPFTRGNKNMSKDPSQDHLFTSMLYYCKPVRGMNIAEVRITRHIKHQLKIFNKSMNAMIVIEYLHVATHGASGK